MGLSFGGNSLSRLALIVVIFTIAAGLIGIAMGPDANWDLRNYHIYNPHALLNNRITFDIAPAQRQSYHNPYADLPFYALISVLNEYPKTIAFIMSVPYGLAGAILLWITLSVLGPLPEQGRDRSEALAERGAAILIGMTGAATVSVIGTTMNEIQMTVFILTALALGVQRLTSGQVSHVTLLTLGLCVGLGGGLKMTYATHGFAIGVALLLMVFVGRLRTSELISSGFGVVLGLGITAGPWMWYLYDTFGNPLFPYYNDIFRSDYAESIRFSDTRFVPSSLLDALAYPFRWNFTDRPVAAELPFTDIRFATVAILGTMALLTRLLGLRSFGQSALTELRLSESEALLFLVCYMGVALIIWLSLFGIYRYTVPLEFLTGPIIVVLVRYLVRPANYMASIIVLTIFIVFTTDPPQWGRGQYENQFIRVDMPVISDNSTLFLLGGEPMGYVAAFVPDSVSVVGLENNFLSSDQRNQFVATVRTILRNSSGLFFAVLPRNEKPESPLLEAEGFTVEVSSCSLIHSNIDDGLRICPIVSEK